MINKNMATEQEPTSEIIKNTTTEDNAVETSFEEAVLSAPEPTRVVQSGFSTSSATAPSADTNKERLRKRHLGYC